MSDATQGLLINGGYAVLIALITAWSGWKASQAKSAGEKAATTGEKNATAIEGVQVSADKAAVKAEAAVEKAQQAVVETVAGNRQVAAVHTLVNGQREAMAARIAELEAENRKLRGN